LLTYVTFENFAGYIPSGTSIESICKLQDENYPGFLKAYFAISDPDMKVGIVLLFYSGRATLPEHMMSMVKDILKTKCEFK
jgi:hypothetical protein